MICIKPKLNVQKAAYKLNQTITEYGLTISVQKTKWMAYKGRDPVKTKIVMANTIIEQLNLFNSLGNISYEGEVEIDNKLNNFLKITGILNNVFRLVRARVLRCKILVGFAVRVLPVRGITACVAFRVAGCISIPVV